LFILCFEGALAAEAVQSLALALQRIDDIHGRDRFASCVLRVSDGVSDDVLEEDFEDCARLFVDAAADALHTTTAREASNGGFGDAVDIVAQHLAMALGAALAESFAAFAAPRHW